MVLSQGGPSVDPVPLFPGDDVEVQVGHRLLGAFAAGAEEVYSVVAAVLHIVLGNEPGGGDGLSATDGRPVWTDL